MWLGPEIHKKEYPSDVVLISVLFQDTIYSSIKFNPILIYIYKHNPTYQFYLWQYLEILILTC